MAITEESDGWVLPLAGKVVTRFIVDDAIAMRCTGADEALTLSIEGPFDLYVDEKVYTIAPEKPASVGPMLPLLFSKVTAARVSKTGRLTVELSGDAVLTLDAEEHFSSWLLRGDDGLRMVSMPEGYVAVAPR